MEDWTEKTDDEVFSTPGEDPGSRASYWRDTEIRRRLYQLEKKALERQIQAIDEQREATKSQRDAINEMRRQSTIMLWSVVGIFVTAIVTLVAAFIS